MIMKGPIEKAVYLPQRDEPFKKRSDELEL
jgi:hypothetical protein